MEEINVIYPEPPRAIDLRPPIKRRSKKVNTNQGLQIKTVASLMVASAAVGAYVLLWLTSPDGKALSSQFETSTGEAETLERIENYCFNPIKQLRDEQTCKLWLGKYRDLGEYTESEMASAKKTIGEMAMTEDQPENPTKGGGSVKGK